MTFLTPEIKDLSVKICPSPSFLRENIIVTSTHSVIRKLSEYFHFLLACSMSQETIVIYFSLMQNNSFFHFICFPFSHFKDFHLMPSASFLQVKKFYPCIPISLNHPLYGLRFRLLGFISVVSL